MLNQPHKNGYNLKEMDNNKIKIIGMHIENDIVNGQPTIVYTDENNEEWVWSHKSLSRDGGGTMEFKRKPESWYFKSENKQ